MPAGGRALHWAPVPTFCRHNRFLANCPICSRDQAPAAGGRRASTTRGGGASTRTRGAGSRSGGGVRVRHVARAVDDGFRSTLVAGLKASDDAARLAEEIAFATARLATLASEPPGLYANVAEAAGSAVAPEGAAAAVATSPAATAGREEATWLAFLIAYLGPLDGEDPFAGVRAAHVPWASGELPSLDDVPLGPRTSHDPARGTATLAAYRAWAQRAGSQGAAFAGEAAWAPERRFARVFERLALPGLTRDARFDLLATLGALGVYELQAATLGFGGADETTVAAKRVFGIGDTLLLDRRAAELAAASDVPLAALDAALWNWSRPSHAGRATLGWPGEPDPAVTERVAAALGL